MDLNKQVWVRVAWDLLLLCGLAVFVFGVGLAWRPLGFIVGGLVLAAVALLGGYRRQENRESER